MEIEGIWEARVLIGCLTVADRDELMVWLKSHGVFPRESEVDDTIKKLITRTFEDFR